MLECRVLVLGKIYFHFELRLYFPAFLVFWVISKKIKKYDSKSFQSSTKEKENEYKKWENKMAKLREKDEAEMRRNQEGLEKYKKQLSLTAHKARILLSNG